MTYNINISDQRLDNQSRFILGTSGKKPLFVIGLNPSTADKEKSDMTIKKIMTFAEQAGFDSFIMLNLYAQRSTYPKLVHDEIDNDLHNENIEKIIATLSKQKNPSILAGWGETIKVKPIFNKCLIDIYDATQNQNIKWLKIGELTKSKHPRHPSRAPYKFGLTEFDIKAYISKLISNAE